MKLRSRRILTGATSEGQFPKLFLSKSFSFLDVLFGYWENVGKLFFFFSCFDGEPMRRRAGLIGVV